MLFPAGRTTWRRVGVAVLLLVTVVCAADAGEAPAAGAVGVLTEQAAGIVQKSIAVGWTPEQVEFLAGKPELVRKFPDTSVTVWRYRLPSEYLLVAFTAGKVSEVSRRPIEASMSAAPRQAASGSGETAAKDSTNSVFDPETKRMLGVTLGDTEPRIRQALINQGLIFSDKQPDAKELGSDSAWDGDKITCTTPSRTGSVCIVPPPSAARWNINSITGLMVFAELFFTRAGRLVAVKLTIGGDDEDAVRKEYVRYSELMVAKYRSPSHKALEGYGRLTAWFIRNAVPPEARLRVSEGWSTGNVESDMLLYESKKSPTHVLLLYDSLPKGWDD